ncbi:TPA: hypothetical protein DDW35_09180 [Candidatus Sumerlaeota bacterium]|jgi:hypothetical protein|nr:hypothetical protein [Candidatus Sumerlaeota bacterium]
MIAKCSWCGKDLGKRDSAPGEDAVITHSICEECADKIFSSGVELRKLLNRLDAPVLVVDRDVCVEMANDQALELLGKNLPEIKDYCGGDVFECVHSREPGGCGRTIHCSGCVIRSVVEDTMKTGRSHTCVPAVLKKRSPDDVEECDMLISTQKQLGMVLLRIDDLRKKETQKE